MEKDKVLREALEKSEIEINHPRLTFDRPVLSRMLTVPSGLKFEQTEAAMLWWLKSSGGLADPTGVLRAFCRLHDAADDEIFRFVLRYGVLGLWPYVREAPGYPAMHYQRFSHGSPVEVEFGERTDLYRRLAKRMRAILLVAASLLEKQTANDSLWEEVLESERFQLLVQNREARVSYGYMSELQYQRNALIGSIEAWTRQVTLRLLLDWSSGGDVPAIRLDAKGVPTLEVEFCQRYEEKKWQERDIREERTFIDEYMHASELFRVLVTDIVAALTSAKHVYKCDQCGEPFIAEGRNPQSRRDKICGDDCRKKRNAKRVAQHYKRKRDKIANGSLQ